MDEGADTFLGQTLDIQGQASLLQCIEPFARLEMYFFTSLVCRMFLDKSQTKTGIMLQLDSVAGKRVKLCTDSVLLGFTVL